MCAKPSLRLPTPASHQALEALYATGHWLLVHARYRDAASVFRAMVQCAPDDERGYLALGACHEAIHQASIALEIYDVAAKAGMVAPRCHIARARLLRTLGRDDEAEAALDAARLSASSDEDLCDLIADERGAS